MRASVLDLGSNSFHVLIADLTAEPHLAPVLRHREMLHLGRAVARFGHVPDEDRARAVATVAHLAGLARRKGAEERLAVATAALRDATNGAEVLAELSEAADTEVALLDGLEEARLAYLGVRSAVAVQQEPVLVLDLGGGSLELAVGVGDEVVWATSARIGASRLSAAVTSDPLGPDDVALLVARVDAELEGSLDVVHAQAPATVVAVGGTVRALARIVAAQRGVWLPATLNQFRLPLSELTALRDRLVASDLAERLRVPGMKDRRADHVHVAAVVLARVLERLGVAVATISDWGLREGLLLDTHGIVCPTDPAELRAGEVERLRATFVPDDPHPPHVAALALQVFDATHELHGLGPSDRELLACAARLHAIGEALALRRQQEHGAYIVQHAELRGFDPSETALLTTLVRFHPSRGIDPAYPPYAALDRAGQDRAERLLALLQLADGLDRAHDQAVTKVLGHHLDGTVQLELFGRGLHATEAEVAHRTRCFARTFGVGVHVVDHAG